MDGRSGSLAQSPGPAEEGLSGPSALLTEPEQRPRRYSGGTILQSPLSGIYDHLRLDRTEARVGERVGVYWDIPGLAPHYRDWIAMFSSGEEAQLSVSVEWCVHNQSLLCTLLLNNS